MGIRDVIRLVCRAGAMADAHVARETTYWTAARRILPTHIREKHEHLVVGNGTYMSCVVVGVPTKSTPGYPIAISPELIGSLLNTAQAHCAIGYSFAVRPFSQSDSNHAMEAAEFQNIADQMVSASKNSLGHVANKAKFVAKDIAEDQRKIHDQDVTMSDTSCIITIRGNSIDDLDIATSHVRSIIKNNLVGCTDPYGQLEATYYAAQPVGDPWHKDVPFVSVDAQSPQVAAMLPVRDPGVRSDDRGIWFGTHKETHAELIYDVDALAAQHGMLLGPTGSGKTTVESILAMRFKDMPVPDGGDQKAFRVVYLTMKSDASTQYRAPADYYRDAGGIIDIGDGAGKSIVNPLQIIFDSSVTQSDKEYLRTYHDHKANVIAFFDAFIKGGLTPPQKNYLDTTLNELYDAAGIISMHRMRITPHPEKWVEGENFPTIHLLRKLWHDDLMSGKLKLLQMSAEAIYNATASLDLSGAYAYLNSTTTADFSKDYIVIDLSGLRKDLQDAMSVLVTGIVSIRFRTDAKMRTLLVIDEGVAFVRNPERMQFVSDASMMGRSLMVALLICFTQTADLSSELASMLKTNSMWSMVLGRGMGVADAKYAQEFFKIPDEYMKHLTGDVPVGDGIFMIRDQIIPMHFTVTGHEMSILKGTYNSPEKHSSDGAFVVSKLVTNLVLEQGFCLDSWIQDPDVGMLKRLGYVPHLVHNTFGNGKSKAWIQSDILKKDVVSGEYKIYNQSVDHYSTVIQIAGYLSLAGFDVVKVSHFDDADVVAELAGERHIFEYERPGSHTKKELQKKKIAAEKQKTTNGRCFFVCQSSYRKFVASAVDGDGTTEKHTVTRGVQLKAAIDGLLHSGATEV